MLFSPFDTWWAYSLVFADSLVLDFDVGAVDSRLVLVYYPVVHMWAVFERVGVNETHFGCCKYGEPSQEYTIIVKNTYVVLNEDLCDCWIVYWLVAIRKFSRLASPLGVYEKGQTSLHRSHADALLSVPDSHPSQH